MSRCQSPVIFVIISLLILFLGHVKGNDDVEDPGKIVLVNIVYRHGNRTPINPYPNDPYGNRSQWPVDWGQLTNVGMMNHYNFGKWVRKRYSDFLPAEYDPADIYVQSTDVDRTLMSAYSHLAGLYEPNPAKNWDADIRWRPIPVHTVPQASDSVLYSKVPCPRYKQLHKDLSETDEFKKRLKENKDIFEALSSFSGRKVSKFLDADYLYSVLEIESLVNYSLPDWTKNFFPQPLQSLSGFSFSIDCYTTEMARLKVGLLIKELVGNMEKKVAGKLEPNRKMFMYSAHDETVGNLLQGLQVFNLQPPPFCSSVIMELTNKSAKYFVSLYYRNSSFEEPHLLTIPGCSSLCPLEDFTRLLTPVMPDDWEKECRLTLYEMVNDVNGVWFMLYASIASLVLITVLLSVRSYRRRHPRTSEFVYQSLSPEAT